ncbi:MAG: hypothetical protein HY842_14410 [Bacteroidetes bacterium]|nr:hypothetical protein [Bacteroidota bacterium]
MPKASALLFFLMNCFSLTAQNLVQNSGFEDHATIECRTCHHRADKFKYTMRNWGNLSTGSPGICDCKFKRTPDDVRSRSCEFEKLQPHSGCTMMQMAYQSRCMDHLHQTWGCSNYLTTSLTHPLLVGKVYEVSFWVFIESPDDLEYANFIGVNLYTEPFNNPHGALLEGSNFPLGTIAFDKWYRVNWFVKPTCELDFLAIGVFRGEDGPPTKTEGFWNIFYVDDVAVVEAKDVTNAQTVRAFCKPAKNPSADSVPFK